MSQDNPDFPIDAKNRIGFFVQFFWGQPGLVGDSVEFKQYLGCITLGSKVFSFECREVNELLVHFALDLTAGQINGWETQLIQLTEVWI